MAIRVYETTIAFRAEDHETAEVVANALVEASHGIAIAQGSQLVEEVGPHMAWLRYGEPHALEPGNDPDRCRLCDFGPSHRMHGGSKTA